MGIGRHENKQEETPKDTYCMIHFYMESMSNSEKQTVEWRLPDARGWGMGEWEMLAKGYKLPAIRLIMSQDLMYSMVTTLNRILAFC